MRSVIDKLYSNKSKLMVFFDQGIVSGSNFIVGILLARFLGIEAYGAFTIAWLLVLFTSSLHQAFITMPLFTLINKQKDSQTYLNQLHTIQIMCTTGVFLINYAVVQGIIWFDATLISPELGLWLPLVSALFIHNDFLRRVVFAKQRPQQVIVMDLIASGAQICAIPTLMFMGRLDVTSVFIIINTLLTLSIVIGTIRYSRLKVNVQGVKKVVSAHWKFSRYLLVTAVLQWFSGNYLLMIGASLVGPVAIGAIRIVQNMMGVLNVIFLAMENIVPLKASEILSKKGRIAMMNYMSSIVKKSVLPLILITAIISVFSHTIITELYGHQYARFSWLVLVFCGLYVFVFFGTILRFLIRTIEDNRTIFIGYAVSSVLVGGFAIPLVEKFELNGILIGLFLSQIICLSIYTYSLKNDIKWIFK